MKSKLYDGQITKNFNIKEFSCKNNNEILINKEVIEHIQRLQKLRDWYKKAIKINSAFRTAEHNKNVGGSPKSQHLKGIATDISLPKEFFSFSKERKTKFLNNIKNKWEELCKIDGIKGAAGFYDTFIHLDSRSGKGNIQFWDNRK